MREGDLLPSEQELCSTYAVSRTTVRLALGSLAGEGLIVRKQGRGSYVAPRKRAVSHTGGLLLMGHESTEAVPTDLVSVEETKANPHQASKLGLAVGEPVYKIRWTESSDGEAFSYRVSYFPSFLFPDLDLEPGALAADDVRLPRFDADIVLTAEHVEVVLADPFRASLLSVSEGTPLLMLEQMFITNEHGSVELTRSFYSGHSVQLWLRPA